MSDDIKDRVSGRGHVNFASARTWLIVRKRETDPVEVTAFDRYDQAAVFYDAAQQQWSDTYFCTVVAGPGEPISVPNEWFFQRVSSIGPEVCICAAIRLADGHVIRGHRHNHAMRTAFDMRIPTVDIRAADQGFVTSRNRYVGREEGQRLQLAAGVPSADPCGYRGDILFSEDLY